MKPRLSFPCVIFLLLAMASCSNTKHLPDNRYLVTQSRVRFAGKNPGIDAAELAGLNRQKPNKRFLGIMRFKLWAYTWSQKQKESRFSNWLENTVGERPVLLDTFDIERSCTEMKKYLENTGYFYSTVDYHVDFRKRKKRAHLNYIVDPARPYRIRKVMYEIEDPVLMGWIMKDTAAALVKPGHVYNVYTLDRERERITDFLNNNGYFGFVRDYIFFEVDSAFNSREMELYVRVKNIRRPDPDTAGKFIEHKHSRYRIARVTVNSDFDPSRQGRQGAPYDTLVNRSYGGPDDHPAKTYNILYRDKLRINPRLLAQNILIEEGEPFKQRDVDETYKRFGSLDIYKYANISFREQPGGADTSNGLFRKLDCRINLQRAPLNQYSIEAEGTNSGGDLGIGGNITYRNRNIFRNGETLQLRLRGALEAQRTNRPEGEDQQQFLFFNTFEYGAEAQLTFPRFLIPVKMDRFSKYFKPVTTISTGYNYRRRPTYDRYVINFIFGYKWQESEYKTHIIQPLNISSVKVFPTRAFTEELEKINDTRLKNQYTDHLIMALQYSFVFNNQDIKKVRDFFYFKGDIETSGNLLSLFSQAAGSVRDTAGFYRIAGIRFAQYGRVELDFRYYWVHTKNSQVVFRVSAGLGLPYGNSESLPFEKGFYLGGANGMRGWIYRDLGPGGFSGDGRNFDKMGDMMIETNIEYRFPVYGFFKGALFTDAGNGWLLRENDNFPNAGFNPDTFYRQIAWDAGIGLRFDFNFFIFRLDFATRLRDPSKPEGKRWVADQGIWFWNLGIGYPF